MLWDIFPKKTPSLQNNAFDLPVPESTLSWPRAVPYRQNVYLYRSALAQVVRLNFGKVVRSVWVGGYAVYSVDGVSTWSATTAAFTKAEPSSATIMEFYPTWTLTLKLAFCIFWSFMIRDLNKGLTKILSKRTKIYSFLASVTHLLSVIQHSVTKWTPLGLY